MQNNSKTKSQLVFIDDSGDPGFKIKKGATKNFVISCIIFDDELEAEKTAVAIKQFRRDLKFSDDVEFKFTKSRAAVREEFLKTVSPFFFRIRCIVVNKEEIRSEELINSKDSFYNYFIKQVLQHHGGTLQNAKIRLDGHGDRLFRRNLTTYLRRELNSRDQLIIKDLQLVDSKTNVLIQMADMISGTIRRSYDLSRVDGKKYRKLIEKKIENCWEFK